MSRKVEVAREVRLWIGQILVPGAIIATGALSIPEVRDLIATKATDIKEKILKKKSKEEA